MSKIEKTLATCKPSEFLKQTYKLKKSAEKWLKDTKILDIRKNIPKLEEVPQNATDEQKKEIDERNNQRVVAQTKENLSKMFDAAFGEYPDETLEILALCCFIEPEHIDDYDMSDYFEVLGALMKNRAVISFFTSLLQWAQTTI